LLHCSPMRRFDDCVTTPQNNKLLGRASLTTGMEGWKAELTIE